MRYFRTEGGLEGGLEVEVEVEVEVEEGPLEGKIESKELMFRKSPPLSMSLLLGTWNN
jgi:hypothetical protein